MAAFQAPFPLISHVYTESLLDQRLSSYSRHSRKPFCCMEKVSCLNPELLRASDRHFHRQGPHVESHYVNRKFRNRRKTIKKRSLFFEGWYFRVVFPDTRNSFAFMFSIEDKLGEDVGAVQVVGPDSINRMHYFSSRNPGFFASSCSLQFGHWETASLKLGVPRILSRNAFQQNILSGYQMTDRTSCGKVQFDDKKYI